MLIDEPKVSGYDRDPTYAMIASIIGGGASAQRLQQGIYLVGHFGSSDFLRGYESYPDLGHDRGAYGVCDSVENLLEVVQELHNPERKFVVTLTSVKRAHQEPSGGWRWHKWGEYIGAHEPQYEYLYDEKGIDEVFCYHIYEKV